MYHGEPEKLSEEYRKVFGTNRASYCTYRPDGSDDYCDTQQCALRHVCDTYKAAYPEPVTPEQAEQMTLQWATRMGGVNTSTGNIHGGEIPNHQRVEDEQPIDRNERWNPVTREPEEEAIINAALDAEEREMEE